MEKEYSASIHTVHPRFVITEIGYDCWIPTGKVELEADPITVEYLPATQSWQVVLEVDPITVEYLPAPQAKH